MNIFCVFNKRWVYHLYFYNFQTLLFKIRFLRMQFPGYCFALWHILVAVLQYSNGHSWSQVGLRKGSENDFFLKSRHRLSPTAITAFSALQHTLQITCERQRIFYALSRISSPTLSRYEQYRTLKTCNNQGAGEVVSHISWSSTTEIHPHLHPLQLSTWVSSPMLWGKKGGEKGKGDREVDCPQLSSQNGDRTQIWSAPYAGK